jgi:hypothetical protein
VQHAEYIPESLKNIQTGYGDTFYGIKYVWQIITSAG